MPVGIRLRGWYGAGCVLNIVYFSTLKLCNFNNSLVPCCILRQYSLIFKYLNIHAGSTEPSVSTHIWNYGHWASASMRTLSRLNRYSEEVTGGLVQLKDRFQDRKSARLRLNPLSGSVPRALIQEGQKLHWESQRFKNCTHLEAAGVIRVPHSSTPLTHYLGSWRAYWDTA